MKPFLLLALAATQQLQFFNDYNQRQILAAIDKLAPSDLNYRPTDEIRGLRQLFGHIADVQHRVCAEAKGEAAPAPIETAGLSKAELNGALKRAFDYCSEAYKTESGKTLRALVINTYHSGQHYGNIVTYLRLKGILPPGAKEDTTKPKRAAPEAGKMETCYMSFLVKGANWSAQRTPESAKIQAAHLAHLRKMAEGGKLLVAGPFLDNHRIRGILIFKASSSAEVTALAGQDPAVQSGRLAVEVYPWMVQKGVLPE